MNLSFWEAFRFLKRVRFIYPGPDPGSQNRI
ncbi:MAG: hypothetical protein JWP12_804 [Bacteroidetes bacterium]|nr:hypothetical protein [Bacteroidota bacterium]